MIAVEPTDVIPQYKPDQVDWYTLLCLVMHETMVDTVFLNHAGLQEMAKHGKKLIFINKPDGVELKLLPAQEADRFVMLHRADKSNSGTA